MAVVRWFNGRCICFRIMRFCVDGAEGGSRQRIFNNRKTVIEGIEARNELFKDDFPREYQTWTETAKTDFESEFNGNVAVDVLEQRPEMVILWAGYAFSKDYSTPRGHMHAIEDITATSAYRFSCRSARWPSAFHLLDLQESDVPRMMEALGVDSFYNNKWEQWVMRL